MTVAELNKLNLNQLCLTKIKEAGAVAEAGSLYALQLVAWLLEERPDLAQLPAAKFLPELETYVLSHLDDTGSFPLILSSQEAEQTLAEKMQVEWEKLRKEPAEVVAQRLLENLQENLSEFVPSLRE